MSHFFFAPAFLFIIVLFEQARAAYAIAVAGGFDGVDRALLDVAIDRPSVNIDEFRGIRDFEQLHISFTNQAPDPVT
jgi:hypothetical protein